jgi:lipoprotein-anchoring transpeptidase ErfK/SrfK
MTGEAVGAGPTIAECSGSRVLVGVMRIVAFVVSMIFAAILAASPAAAGRMTATVSLSKQVMVVKVDGETVAVWRVSTGKRGYATPRGVYSPKRLSAKHFSRKYNNAPMPYAVFFRGGYAVHGTTEVARLGRPASHGCVRLATGNAAKFFRLVQKHGKGSRIVIAA